jgi:xylan 1,4-beta-xylosidase
VWNEPNLKAFWPASQKDYFRFYRDTARALKTVDAKLRVGGPATANDEWIDEFVDFADGHDAPADFISTHHYPTDAFGSEDEDTEAQLAAAQRSVLRERAQDTHRRARGRPLYYTEWNTSSSPNDPLHDEPYAAAVIVKTMMEAAGLAEGYSFWTFSDIFSENFFPSMPFHGGFGLLNLQGVAKPSYRAFELLHRLGDEKVLVDGIHPTVDCWAVKRSGIGGRAGRPAQLCLMLTNHALPRHHILPKRVRVAVKCDRPRRAYVERIDEHHAHARRAWEAMGKPEYPSDAQVARLDRASRLKKQQLTWRFSEDTAEMTLELPPHAVAAVTLEFGEASGGDQ